MFKLFSELAVAWNQVGLLIGGGFFAGLGALLLGNRLYWRMRAMYVDGTIIGVRQSNTNFFPVYRYALPTGEVEALSDTGSSDCRSMNTGRSVRLMVFPSEPTKVSDAHSYFIEIVSIILLGVSIWLIHFSLAKWRVNAATLVVAIGLLGYLAARARKVLAAVRGQSPGIPGKMASRAALEAAPLLKIEDLDPAVMAGGSRQRQPNIPPYMRVLIIAFGCVLIVASVYIARNVLRLESTGQRVDGAVVALRAESDNSGSILYRAIVRFAPAGTSMDFADDLRSNPPSYHVGDHVTVLYEARAPARTAHVDRGFWNWLPPIATGLFGLLALLAGVRTKRQGDTDATPLGSPQ